MNFGAVRSAKRASTFRNISFLSSEVSMEDRTNGVLFTILVGIGGTGYFLWMSYWPWLKPEEWRKRARRYREYIWTNWSFLPEGVLYRYLKKHPNIDLWYARIGYLFLASIFFLFTLWFYLNLSVFLKP
jgi:hypothetical protein